ncbi:unnamed protein product [Mytilus edulis]|uniref:DDE Tnp4 domain-containing protein n=1 Tax=Mytilus edulis TaxID=6550 RepID=A0A8S3TYQ7_MYTED|nr:unnamed protein product [Mytilus edulis]
MQLRMRRRNQRRRRKPRSVWVRKWLSERRRQQYGHFTTVLKELKTEDDTAFYNYTRLPRGLYDEVLKRIQYKIQKQDTWYRKSLSPGLKLSITLRHLASGDSYQTLAYNFRVAPNTISLIVQEVCDAIKDEFATEGIQCPTETEEWASITDLFEKRWQFPHCFGALDGKHVEITCPWNTVSEYRNYKVFFSVVLMALVDADYKFIWIDVGSDGSGNDASIYNGSELKEGLESSNNVFNLPEEKQLPGDDVPVPYFIVGDNAFGIDKRLMNPYSIRNMEYDERIFNYRLSRGDG